MRDYKLGIALKEVNSGYEKTIFSSGFGDADKVIEKANKVIREKFGSKEILTLTKSHKNRRSP
jgi:hypothetical protein